MSGCAAPTERIEIVLDRPDRSNALDAASVDALLDQVSAAMDSDARVVTIAARGPVFCAGFDLTGLEAESDATLAYRFVRIQLLLERIQSLPMLTVALLDGPAVGAGADLALAADVRLCSTRARLRFPGSGFGAVLGVRRLAMLTTPGEAVEVAANGRWLDAQECVRRGICQPSEAEFFPAKVDDLVAETGRLPRGMHARLRLSAADPALDAQLADLVRSVASTRGLRERLQAHRAKVLPEQSPQES